MADSPLSAVAQQICERRYFQKDKDGNIIEDWSNLVNRVVNHVCKNENKEYQEQITSLLYNTEFLPNSPCLVNAGTSSKSKGLLACFVTKAPEDSWVGMIENIGNFGHVARQGGGCGVDFSQIRPEADPVFGSTHAKACGPIEHMRMISEVMSSITQSGFRGMAMMSCLRVDHPDIMKFIVCKQRDRALKTLLKEDIFNHYDMLKDNVHEHLNIVLDKFISNFNISAFVTDDFMNKVKNNEDYDLVFNNKVYETLKARDVFDAIVENAWKNGDPGMLFHNAINSGPYKYSGQTITATNPCVTGDTMVAVADGRTAVPISQLALEDKDVQVYCRKPNGNVTIRMMRRPRISGYNQKILKIVIENGHVLRVTENHKFTLSDGTIKEAKNLQPNDSLSILNRVEAPFEEMIKGWNSKSQKYAWLRTSECKGWKLEHRMIYNFHSGRRLSYSDGAIHHKDFNGLNNHPENLEHMSKKDHDLLHSKNMIGDKNPMRRAEYEWSESKWKQYRKNMSQATSGLKNGKAKQISNEDLFKIAVKQSKEIGRKLSEPEWKDFSKKNNLVSQFSNFRTSILGVVSQFLRQAAIEAGVLGHEYSGTTLREYKNFLQIESDLDVFFDDTIKVRKICEYCKAVFIVPYYQREIGCCSISCSCTKKNKSDKMRQKVRQSKIVALEKRRKTLLKAYCDFKAETRIPLKKGFTRYCRNHDIPFRIPSKREVREGKLHPIFESWIDLQNQAELFNHRVISIEEDGKANVYTGTVDDYHNYYIGHFEELHKDKYSKYIYVNNLQCGEQVLPPYGSCNLGSVDVAKFYNENREAIEWTRLGEAIKVAVQFLDNVLEINKFPTPDFAKWAKQNRPVGLGIMGWADLLLKMKIAYGSKESLELAKRVGRFFEKTAHEKSVELGKERGTPLSCRFDELEHRRNTTTLSIAPTGTISLLASCSSSVEPVFSAKIFRYDNTGQYEIDHPHAKKSYFRCASNLKWEEHVDMQAAFQPHIDSAISKTINLPNEATKEDIAAAYMRAWESGCKGVTVYRDGCKTTQVLNASSQTVVGTNQAVKRPKQVEADIFKRRAMGFDWHFIVGKVNGRQELPKGGNIVKHKKRHYSLLDEDGNTLVDNLDKEESSIDPRVSLETRRFSLELRHGIDPKYIVKQIDKNNDVITSFSKACSRLFKTEYLGEQIGVPCPDCARNGEEVEMISEGGCWSCPTCHFSRCG